MKMDERPTIETERLLLRPFVLLDAEDVQRLAGERAVSDTTLTVPYPYKDGMAEEWISTHEPKYLTGELVNFAVALRPSGDLIGAIGLHLVSRFNRAELGYWIGKDYWNQGCCTEASRRVLRYGFMVLKLNRIYAAHMVHNPSSGRVMEKIGMTYEGRSRQHVKKGDAFFDLERYGIIKAEWNENTEPGARGNPATPAATA